MNKRRANISRAGPSSKKAKTVTSKRRGISELPSKDWKVATTGEFDSSTTTEIEQRLHKHGVKILYGVDKKTSYLILGSRTTTTRSFGRQFITGVGSTRYLCAVRDAVPIMKESELLPLLDQADLALAVKEGLATGNKKKKVSKAAVNKKKKNVKKVVNKKKKPTTTKKGKNTVKENDMMDDASDDEVGGMMLDDDDDEDGVPLEVDSDDDW